MTQTPVIPGAAKISGERAGIPERHRKSTQEFIPSPSGGEQHSRQLIDLLPNAVVALRGETIIYANPAAAALVGAASAEQLIGRLRSDLVHPVDGPPASGSRTRVETGHSLPPAPRMVMRP